MRLLLENFAAGVIKVRLCRGRGVRTSYAQSRSRLTLGHIKLDPDQLTSDNQLMIQRVATEKTASAASWVLGPTFTIQWVCIRASEE